MDEYEMVEIEHPYGTMIKLKPGRGEATVQATRQQSSGQVENVFALLLAMVMEFDKERQQKGLPPLLGEIIPTQEDDK